MICGENVRYLNCLRFEEHPEQNGGSIFFPFPVFSIKIVIAGLIILSYIDFQQHSS